MNIEDHRGGPPHAAILTAVAVVVLALPMLIGDRGAAITAYIAELLSPVGLLLLPIVLLLTIHFLSSDAGSYVAAMLSAAAEPNSIHRATASPVGVALFLAMVLLLLYNRVTLFGGDDDSGD